MKRRAFFTLLGGAAASCASWPLSARAQQPKRVRKIGVLIGADESDPNRRAWIDDFRNGLRELGWIEGQTIQSDWRWAAANRDRASTYAAELVALNPEVIFGDNTFVVRALQQATRTLPIVFAMVNNPLLSGFVASLARPGGNITGFSDSEPLSLSKLPEFMRQIAPLVTSVAIIADGQTLTEAAKARTQGIATAASSVGLKVAIFEVRGAGEIESAIAAAGREPNGGLIVPGNPVTNVHRKLILSLAARHELPAICGYRYYAVDGGLLSYGTKSSEQYRGAAGYVDRILKGAKPSELPVQQPTKFELVINLKTAKALGLTVPPSLLALADEVIE
jgi:putative tryptophan/tyrosine transport system substrate-binding protein